jgi:hypothetical protein
MNEMLNGIGLERFDAVFAADLKVGNATRTQLQESFLTEATKHNPLTSIEAIYPDSDRYWIVFNVLGDGGRLNQQNVVRIAVNDRRISEMEAFPAIPAERAIRSPKRVTPRVPNLTAGSDPSSSRSRPSATISVTRSPPGDTRPADRRARVEDEQKTKTCPECAETVMAAAKICRFCRHSFRAEQTER